MILRRNEMLFWQAIQLSVSAQDFIRVTVFNANLKSYEYASLIPML